MTGADVIQDAYEIEVAAETSFESPLAATGVVASDAQLAVVAPGGPLESREVRHYRVRVSDAGGWSGWSEALRVEAGLLRADDWVGTAITLPDDPGSRASAPAPMLRRAFEIGTPISRARLHVTALGLHQVTINGERVSGDLLAPGWTAYRHRLACRHLRRDVASSAWTERHRRGPR